MRFGPFSFILLIIVCRLAMGETRAEQPVIIQSEQLREIGSTLRYFTPKISAASLRFVFVDGGHLFTELNDDQSMLFLEYGDRKGWDFREHTSMEVILPPMEEDWVLDKIPESMGDRYGIVYFGQHFVESTNVTGLTLLWSGDGYRGFLGRLGRPSREIGEGANFLRPVGLSFRTNKNQADIVYRAMPAPGLDTEELDRAVAPIHTLLDDEAELIGTQALYALYPDTPGFLCLLESSTVDQRFLYVVLRMRPGQWRICAIDLRGSADSAPGGGVVIHTGSVEHHHGLRSVESFILPDLDGDGASEIVLVSDSQSFILTLQRKDVGGGRFELSYTVERMIYFGL